MTPEEPMTNTVPAPADTNGNSQVLAYRMGQVEIAVKEGMKDLKIEMRLLRDGFVSNQRMADAEKAAEVVHTEIDKRVTRLENWNTWLVRLVLTAVILAIISLVVKPGITRIIG